MESGGSLISAFNRIAALSAGRARRDQESRESDGENRSIYKWGRGSIVLEHELSNF